MEIEMENISSSSSSDSEDAEAPLLTTESVSSIQTARLTKGFKDQSELNTYFLESVEVKDPLWAKSCLENGADASATCKELLISACHLAAFSGDAEILEDILKLDPTLSVRGDNRGRMPLHFSAWNGHLNCVNIILQYMDKDKYLNSNYGDMDNISNYCDSSHSCGTLVGYMDMVWGGCTALHIACAKLHSDCVNALLRHGARTDATEINYGLTPFEYCGKAYAEDWTEANGRSLLEVISYISATGNKRGEKWEVQRPEERRTRPFHVAVLLTSRKSIKLLLELGCDPQILDENGQTPLHLAIDHKRLPPLKILANWKSKTSEKIIETPNGEGRTPLQHSIYEEWLEGVRILLAAEASLTAVDLQLDTPLHVAAKVGNLEILDEIVTSLPDKKACIDAKNTRGETPLVFAIKNGNEKCVRSFLHEGASMNILSDGFNVLHLAMETENPDVLDALIESGQYKELLNEKDIEHGMTPLHWAAYKNKHKYVRTLLDKGAVPTEKTSQKQSKFYGYTALHIAANEGHPEVITVLLEKYPHLIDERDDAGWLPFHRAVYNCHRECITIFLNKGSNFAENVPISDKESKPVIKILTQSMPRFADYLTEIFDSCIKVNEYDLNQPQCEVTIDYSVILPKHGLDRLDQMNVTVALFATGNKEGHSKLLLHPFMESFLFFKWTFLKSFFFVMMALYTIFVVLLTSTTLSLYHDKYMLDKEESDNTTETSAETGGDTARVYKAYNITLIILLLISIIVIGIQEILFIRIKKLKYFSRFESWIKSLSIILSLMVVMAELSGSDGEWSKYVTAIALLLSWMEIVILFSRFPEFGYYFQMFSTVALRGLKVLSLFGCFIIFGFTLVFFILFSTKSSFVNIWDSLVKTTIMMTSEFDYSDLFEEEDSRWSFRRALDQTFFIIFVFFVPIVTANLLSALAVSDIKDLEIEGKVQRLEEQADFLGTHEILIHHVMTMIVRSEVLRNWTIANQMTLHPGSPKWKKLNIISSSIAQSIYDKITERRRKEAGENRYEDVVRGLKELKNEVNDIKEYISSLRNTMRERGFRIIKENKLKSTESNINLQ